MAYKLLLADDSVTIQRVIELTFADEDIHVTAVGDGRQAMERIAAEPPDIVLADVGMPERDGFEVAAFVKQNPDLSRIPVLLLTGAFEPVDEARVRAVGCDGVLAKPFEPQLLIAKVKELLARPSGERPAEVSVQPVGGLDDEPIVIPPDDAGPAGNLDGLNVSPSSGPDSRAAVDEYFDRLDAAFATLAAPGQGAEAVPPPVVPADTWASDPAGGWSSPILPAEAEPAGIASDGGIADLARPATAWNAPAVSASLTEAGAAAFVPAPAVDPAPVFDPTPAVVSPAPPASAVSGAPAEVAAAFDWLLASEQGRYVPPEARPAAPAGASRDAALDALADEVARRVIDRLAEQGVRDQVADIVSRVAERVVREEIERLKAGLK